MNATEKAERFKQAREELNIHGYQSMGTVSDKTRISKTTISKLENKNDMTGVNYIDIVTLADYYGVNVAWLMGQAGSSPSLDIDSQLVTRAIGLSPNAVNALRKITDKSEKRALNEILESEAFGTVVTWLSLAEGMIRKSDITSVESWDEKQDIGLSFDDEFNVEMKLSPKESARYLLSRAMQTAQDGLSLLIREQWTNKVTNWVNDTKGDKRNGKRNKKN